LSALFLALLLAHEYPFNPYPIPRFLSKDFADFAEFAEENFYRRVFKHLHCTKTVQLRVNLRKFRPERARRSRGESNGRKYFLTGLISGD